MAKRFLEGFECSFFLVLASPHLANVFPDTMIFWGRLSEIVEVLLCFLVFVALDRGPGE